MKTKIIFLLACSSVLFSSCEIINPIFNPQTSGCVLQKTSWTIPNDPAHEETEFIYNSSGKLIEVIKTAYDLEPDPYIERWTMTYQGDLVHKIVFYSKLSDPEEIIGAYEFIYNGNLADTIKYTPGDTYYTPTYSVAQYNGNKLSMLSDYRLNPFDTVYTVFNTTEFVWTGDNISKITSTYQTSTPRIYEYEYDDKKAPLSHLGLAFSSYGSFTMLSKNNVLKTKLTMGTDVVNYESSYTYNSTDYPISIKPLDAHPTNYEYDCK